MTPVPPEESPANDGTPSPLSEPGAHPPPAEVDYELIRLIGQGGYGEVWLVREKAGNYRACKVVYRESFRQDRPYEREYDGICKFEPVSRASESQIKILHVGRRDALGYFFYIMELADDVSAGRTVHPDQYIPRTLKSELEQKKRLPASECLQIGLLLSEALENLHGHGLIHRDIKPGNIIFVNGRPKLADIGLVTDLDVTVSYVGTEGYIPPEGPTSPQADVYGLGKVLYEISMGKDRLDYPELPADFAELPDWEQRLELNAIITKACEAEAGRRYASARELHADLAALAGGTSVRRKRASQRRRSLAMRAGLVLAAFGLAGGGLVWLSNHSPPSETPLVVATGPKMPEPNAVLVAQNEAKIKGAYYNQIVSGTEADKQQVVATLLNRSATESAPAMELAELRVAAQLAAGMGDYSRAMEICERMAARFETDILSFKAGLLSQSAASAHKPKNKSDLAEVSLVTGFQAIAADDYTNANILAALALTAAQDAGRSNLIWQAEFLTGATTRCAGAFEQVKPFAATLQEKTDDPAANLAMGKFLCFFKNDWAAGLPLMARSGDGVFAPVARQEINGPSTRQSELLALGDAWWSLSTFATNDDQPFCQQRARDWYLKGIASAKAPDRTLLRQRLAERLSAVPTQAAEVHIVSRVGGTEFIDIYSDEIQWHGSHRGAVGNRINQVDLGDFSTSDLQIIKNSEATWLMPGPVDFSTARLDRDRKSSRHGQEKLTIFDDHVRITLSHPKGGTAAMDVTVFFGSPPPAASIVSGKNLAVSGKAD